MAGHTSTQCPPCRFSHDGKLLGVASEEPALEVFRTDTGASLGKVMLRACPADVAWNPTRPLLAIPGGSDRDSTGMEHGLVDLRWVPGGHSGVL